MASSSIGWHRITRAELKAWDDDMANVAMEATGYGWEGKFSSRGHLLMRAPDSSTTMSISKRAAKSSLQNTRADFARWKKSQPGSAFGDTAVKAAAGVEDLIQVQGQGTQPAIVMPVDILDYVRHDRRVGEHLRRLIDEGLTVDQVKQRITLASDVPPEELTVAGPWVVLDRLTHRAVSWGSAMTEADAYALVYTPDDETTDEMPGEAEEPQPAEKERPMTTQVVSTWECETCGETFDTPHHKAAHTKVHVPERVCALCGARVKYLDTHLQRQHSTTQAGAEVKVRTTLARKATAALDQDALAEATRAVRRLLEAATVASDAETVIASLRSDLVKAGDENAALRAENQELKAKISLIKEAFGA